METAGILRSLLFAPANVEKHARKALASGADGAILDLEDAVAVAEKPAAREAARHLLRERAERSTRPQAEPAAFVRINALQTPFAYDDLLAIVGPGLDGIVAPKVESAAQVATLDWLLTQLERHASIPSGSIEVLPIIETAAGLMAASEIARTSPRVRRLNFGAGDFSLDTNMLWREGAEGLVWARTQVVIVSRAAGLEPPIDTVYADLSDLEGLEREARQALRLGFVGKACIHPTQVRVVNGVFTPGPEEVASAERIVRAFEDAVAQGNASIRVGAQFVDYPVAERARRTLARAAQAQARATA